MKMSNYRLVRDKEINKSNDLFFSYKTHRWKKLLKNFVGKHYNSLNSKHLRRKFNEN